MKNIRFLKVVGKSGRPKVYLLMSETDPAFHKALDAGRIMSLSDESHGAGNEYGRVGYDKKRRGQLLIFPRSLKPFAEAKIVGIKYDLFAEGDNRDEKESPLGKRTKLPKKKAAKERTYKTPAPNNGKKKKAQAKSQSKKVIPFPASHEERDDECSNGLKADVRQAMRALEKDNSVAAYNILKRIIPDS